MNDNIKTGNFQSNVVQMFYILLYIVIFCVRCGYFITCLVELRWPVFPLSQPHSFLQSQGRQRLLPGSAGKSVICNPWPAPLSQEPVLAQCPPCDLSFPVQLPLPLLVTFSLLASLQGSSQKSPVAKCLSQPLILKVLNKNTQISIQRVTTFSYLSL